MIVNKRISKGNEALAHNSICGLGRGCPACDAEEDRKAAAEHAERVAWAAGAAEWTVSGLKAVVAALDDIRDDWASPHKHEIAILLRRIAHHPVVAKEIREIIRGAA